MNSESEAEAYVNSVMSSQSVSAVTNTPLPSNRKRSLSASAVGTEIKKHKPEQKQSSEYRPTAKARRSILKDNSGESEDEGTEMHSDLRENAHNRKGKKSGKKAKKGKTEAENEPIPSTSNDGYSTADNAYKEAAKDGDTELKVLLRRLSDNMESMHHSLNKRIDTIQAMIEESEKKVTEKVVKLIDKRVSTEASRIRKEFDEKLHGLKSDFDRDVNEIYEKLREKEQGSRKTEESERKLRVVVRNLPESVNENVTGKVNSVIKDGLRLRGIEVVSAERRESRQESRPGVIIAKFKNAEEKKAVMTEKKILKGDRQYSNVYIDHDQSREARTMARNMRTLLNGVKRGQNLHVRGSRILTSRNDNQVNRAHENDTKHRDENRRNEGDFSRERHNGRLGTQRERCFNEDRYCDRERQQNRTRWHGDNGSQGNNNYRSRNGPCFNNTTRDQRRH